MKKILMGLFVAFSLFAGLGSASAQVKDASQRLAAQALKMGQALASADYKTFTAYSHPYIVKLVGGPAKMEEMLKQVTAGMQQQGMSFSKISVGTPSKLVKSGNEWQAMIEQHTELKTPKGVVGNPSLLLAFSTDNGMNWKFLDTHNKSSADIRKAIPNLSPEIQIPATAAPQGH